MSGISNQLRTQFIGKVEGQLWRAQALSQIQVQRKQAQSPKILPELKTEEYESYLKGVNSSSSAKNNICLALKESRLLLHDFLEYLNELMCEIDAADYDVLIPGVIKVPLEILADFFQAMAFDESEEIEPIFDWVKKDFPEFGKKILDLVYKQIFGEDLIVEERSPETVLKIFRPE